MKVNNPYRNLDALVPASSDLPLALALLKHAVSEPLSAGSGQRPPLALATASEREFQWLLQAGWGPLILRAIQGRTAGLPAAWQAALQSAELTAQVRCGALTDTANELIDTCRTLHTGITLLKGISVSDQFYPAAHLRPMSDIDVLVDPQACAPVEAALLGRGYGRDATWPPGLVMHHGAPLRHPERRVWVELHTHLYPEGDELRRGLLFSPQHVAAQSVDSSFHGRPVKRLSDELQLVYVASSWMRDLIHSKIHPSFLNSLLDVVHLLRVAGHRVDWDKLLEGLDNDMAAASLYVTLGYVARHGLGAIAPQVLSALAARQNLVGAIQGKLIHATLDRYLIGGRPWNMVLPPPVPARYSLRYQLRKRFGLLLAR